MELDFSEGKLRVTFSETDQSRFSVVAYMSKLAEKGVWCDAEDPRVAEIELLPGITPESARKLIYHVIRNDERTLMVDAPVNPDYL